MTDTAAPTPSLSRAIHSKLNALRRAVGRWLFVRGVAIVLLWLVGLLLLDLAIDWFFPMDLSQRVVVLLIILGVVVFIGIKHLIRPMIGRLDDDTLALRVEAGHKELGQRLISALQFARVKNPEKLGVSPAMVNATIEQGNDVANQVRFDDVLDQKVFTRNVLITIVMLLVLGGGAVGVMASDLLNAWFKRNLMLADVRYPRQTFFGELDNITEMTLPRGDDWDATVFVTGVIPENVYLDFEPVTGNSITQQMVRQTPKTVLADTKPGDTNDKENKADKNKADDKSKPGEVKNDKTAPADASTPKQKPVQFTTLFKNVLHPFRFRVRGDDRHSATHWITVKLVDRPSIESFRLTLTPPRYTGNGPEDVWKLDPPTMVAESEDDTNRGEGAQRRATGSSSVYALKGSEIVLEATSNKPLSKATLKTPKGTIELPLEQTSASDENGNPKVVTRFKATIPAEELDSATYAIELFDTSTTPLASKRPTRFNVRIKPDREPVVKAQLRGISSMIVADARIPIVAYLRDDYHITKAGVKYAFRGEGEDADKGDGMFEFDQLKYDETKFNGEAVKHPYNFEVIGLKLKETMSLSFYVEATDNDNISGPNVGKSQEFYVRVVSDQELREDINRREQEQRMEFERLIRAQEDLIADTQVAISQINPAVADITPEVRQMIMQTQKRQKLAGDRCLQIAKQYDNLLLEYLNNKLEDENGPNPKRMSNLIIAPLNRIGNVMAPDAAVTLDDARKAQDGEARLASLKITLQKQEAVLGAMHDVLRYMNKWSSYQEAVTLMYQVLSLQGKVNRETIRAHQKRIQSIFGDDDKGDDDKNDEKKD